MLADVALYEGTYCKYRKAEDNAGKGPDATRAKTYLNACVEACKVIMGNAAFKLNDTYQGNYNSTDLSKNPEIIFYKPYSKNTLMHSLIDYTVNTGGTNGMTKDAFDNYLFLDGKPRASTTLNKTDAPKMVIVNVQKKVDGVMKTVQDTSYHIGHLFTVRDKRLSATLDSVLAFKGIRQPPTAYHNRTQQYKPPIHRCTHLLVVRHLPQLCRGNGRVGLDNARRFGQVGELATTSRRATWHDANPRCRPCQQHGRK